MKDYVPLVNDGAVPPELVIDYLKEIQSVVERESILDKESALKFYQEIAKEKKELFDNGNIYFNDSLTAYVNGITDKLLINKSDLRTKIKVYVTRYSSPNAMALPDGSIFINVGLLIRMENEAQLAFILGHELAHFELNHSVQSLIKLKDIKDQEENNYNPEGNIFRSLRYSREHEFEADSKGLQLMLNAGYSPHESYKALNTLTDKSYSLLPDIKHTIQKIFASDEIIVDTSLFNNTNGADSSEKIIVFNSPSEDLFTTHPHMDKRIQALKQLISLSEKETTGAKYIFSDSIRSKKNQIVSSFESIENSYFNSDYLISLYFTLKWLQSFPDNKYLKAMVAKNLYWLAYYKEIESLNGVLQNSSFEETQSYNLLVNFIKNINHNELKKLAYSYVKKCNNEDKQNEELAFYYGLLTEAYVGKEPGKLIFNQYLLRFPDGKYYLFAQSKAK